MNKNGSVSKEKLYLLTEKAFNNDEVYEFFIGKDEYACPDDKLSSVYFPTDFPRIIKEGIYKLYEKTKNEDVIEKTLSALKKLSSGNAADIWICYCLCREFIINEHSGEPSFHIITPELLSVLHNALMASKERLISCRQWQGWSQPQGLWSDICRMDKALNDSYNFGILSEIRPYKRALSVVFSENPPLLLTKGKAVRLCEFNEKIITSLFLDETLILLTVSDNSCNIYAYDKNGKVAWQYNFSDYCDITDIKINDDGLIDVYTKDSVCAVISSENGKRTEPAKASKPISHELTVKVRRNILEVNKNVLRFDTDILHIIVADEHIIILTEPSSEPDNIYCIDLNGNMKWRVEQRKEYYTDSLNIPPYVKMNLMDNGMLWLVDEFGGRYICDPRGGKVVGRCSYGKD